MTGEEHVTSTSGETTQLNGLSFIDDITGLIHGKGGTEKIRPMLDLLEQFAKLAATVYPPAAPIAFGVEAALKMGEAVVGSPVVPDVEEPDTPPVSS